MNVVANFYQLSLKWPWYTISTSLKTLRYAISGYTKDSLVVIREHPHTSKSANCLATKAFGFSQILQWLQNCCKWSKSRPGLQFWSSWSSSFSPRQPMARFLQHWLENNFTRVRIPLKLSKLTKADQFRRPHAILDGTVIAVIKVHYLIGLST